MTNTMKIRDRSGKPTILVIDDDASLRRVTEYNLEQAGYRVLTAVDGRSGVQLFREERPPLVITDLQMPGLSGLEVLEQVKAAQPETLVVVITAYGTIEQAVEAMKKGAHDFLTKPVSREALLLVIDKACRLLGLQEENRQLREQLGHQVEFSHLVGSSDAMAAVLETVRRAAPSDATVLITGESGTGKELIARAIHQASDRRKAPFVAVNCAAIPADLLESELFGHVRGAFTGAVQDRAGKFERADGGTLFLDEVGNLPLNVQKTLLRFLQEQEFRRLGETTATKVNVRLISATNSDLTAEVAKGTFREDLFYRLNVINLHLPPLRERRDDIPLLVAHFIREQNTKFGTSCKGLTPEALEAACAYPWPGNIRQLRNVIEAAMTIESGIYIGLPALSQFIVTELPSQFSSQADYEAALARFETEYLTRLLRKHAGNVEAAAAEAGMNMATVYRKLKKYGIRKKTSE
jgi:DNA-binding NtrC family response regulator